jgi:hypothetical protein
LGTGEPIRRAAGNSWVLLKEVDVVCKGRVLFSKSLPFVLFQSFLQFLCWGATLLVIAVFMTLLVPRASYPFVFTGMVVGSLPMLLITFPYQMTIQEVSPSYILPKLDSLMRRFSYERREGDAFAGGELWVQQPSWTPSWTKMRETGRDVILVAHENGITITGPLLFVRWLTKKVMK